MSCCSLGAHNRSRQCVLMRLWAVHFNDYIPRHVFLYVHNQRQREMGCAGIISYHRQWNSVLSHRSKWRIFIWMHNARSSSHNLSQLVQILTNVTQILSGRVPYHYLVREGQVLMELHHGNKPNRPSDGFMTDSLWRSINACWASTPSERPTMEKVWKYIKHQVILENLPC